MVDVVDKLRGRLEGGLIPAAPIPFHADGRLHGGAQAAYLRYMSEQPIAGVAVWAHTGRGLLVDEETVIGRREESTTTRAPVTCAIAR